MRALAGELRAAAARVGRLAAVRTPTWRGASADAFAGQVARQQATADATADQLSDAARLLDNAADDVQREQRAWQRKQAAYERALQARQEMIEVMADDRGR
jgi:uncharacterized protein YukE